ncbi:Isochorismatase hydrolase [Collybia nuda]|uniref:Isochorismatase hydrolase n=1 Tax=Collybia nuda TaxID=64659 RepID=A0A9P6C990_9AGAR|nr:Isochorismatase hydrolase [Collybia nuda]
MAGVYTLVSAPVEYGTDSSGFWVEYPSGLVDLSRSQHTSEGAAPGNPADEPILKVGQADISVDKGRSIRIDTKASAMVIIDMQNFFLHPELRRHPTGLACVDSILSVLPIIRSSGIKVLWVNWGLTEHELQTIPPSLCRSFRKNGHSGGFGSQLPGKFGRLLMRDEVNSELYGQLQSEYFKGKAAGTDFWINKNRMSGLWGYQTALDLYLKENGISTLLFGGVNADQCVLGTVVDAYSRGYDCILVQDATATTSPDGGLSNFIHNTTNSYGYVTDTTRLQEMKRSNPADIQTCRN